MAMQNIKNSVPEIIEHINPLAESYVAPVVTAEESSPLKAVAVNAELLARSIRYLKQIMPLCIPKI